jgi:hypothetical protein
VGCGHTRNVPSVMGVAFTTSRRRLRSHTTRYERCNKTHMHVASAMEGR